MSLILSQGTLPEGTEIKTYGSLIPDLHGVHIGPLTISMKDWVECVMYVMMNTDLEPDDPRLKLLERIKALSIVPGWMKGHERLGFSRGAQPTAVIVDDAEPDMARMGASHVKPCTGCDALLLWAKHVRTEKPAPLIKAVEGEKPNIAAWFDEEKNQWLYEIGGTRPQEFVNHFSNCSRAKDFKPHAWKDATTRG